MDAHANFAYSTVAVAPVPALTGLSLTVAAGQGALFPAVPFNCTVWPTGTNAFASNAEIIRVTAVVGDTLTIVRAQEGTAARSIVAGDQIANTMSVKVFTDIENVIIQGISAGAAVAGASQVVFSNSNGVSFGVAGQTVTASHDGITSQSNPAFSAQGGSSSFQTLAFNNANGLTFSNNAGSIEASYTVPTQSTQPVAASASNGSFLFSTLGFSNGNGVTFGTSAGSIISASVAAGAAPGSISAGTASVALGQVIFSNSNNVSFGLNGSVVTASASISGGGAVAFSASGGSSTFQTLNFNNANGITFSNNAGSVQASHNGITSQTVQPVAASASNGSFLFSTLGFSNANGVTFGTSAGSIVTASVATAAGGAGFTASIFEAPVPLNNNTTIQGYTVPGKVVFDPFNLPFAISFNYVQMLVSASVSFTPASVSTDSTGSANFGIALVLFTRSVTNSAATNFSNSSIILSHISQSWTLQLSSAASSSSKTVSYFWQTDSTGGSTSSTQSTNSSQMIVPGMTGRMFLGIPWVASLSAGEYWMGRLFSSAHNNNASLGFGTSVYEMSWNANSSNRSSLGDTGAGAIDGRNAIVPGMGFYSVSTAVFPNSINLTNDIVNSNFGGQNRRYYLFKP